MPSSTNVVVLVGNLTRDPELKDAGDSKVCRLGIAVNERRKRGEEWVEEPNYFDVDVFGAQGESCAEYLAKGRQVVVHGRLRRRSWETEDGKRSAVSIVANPGGVQFIGPRGEASERSEAPTAEPAQSSDSSGGALDMSDWD